MSLAEELIGIGARLKCLEDVQRRVTAMQSQAKLESEGRGASTPTQSEKDWWKGYLACTTSIQGTIMSAMRRIEEKE